MKSRPPQASLLELLLEGHASREVGRVERLDVLHFDEGHDQSVAILGTDGEPGSCTNFRCTQAPSRETAP